MKEVTDEDFELEATGKCLLDFFATWCPPCKIMIPVLNKLESEFPDIKFIKINCEGSNLSKLLKISTIPTFIFIDDGKEIDRIVGVISKEEFKKKLENIFG